MNERFLNDIIKEAVRPKRRWFYRGWFYDYWWTVPAGFAFAFGLTAAYLGWPFVAAAFIFGGAGICWIGRETMS